MVQNPTRYFCCFCSPAIYFHFLCRHLLAKDTDSESDEEPPPAKDHAQLTPRQTGQDVPMMKGSNLRSKWQPSLVYERWRGATPSNWPRYSGFTFALGHTTMCRTPVDEWSARRRYPYLTTQNAHKQWRTEGVVWGFNPPPKFRNFDKVPKIKKILLYEMKFLVPNHSCLQNTWLGGHCPQIPVLSVLNWICWTPPPRIKFLGAPLLIRERYPRLRRDSNPQSNQRAAAVPRLRPPGHCHRHRTKLLNLIKFSLYI
jgi:hypothetical protein